MTPVSKAKAIARPILAYYRESAIYRLRHASSTRDVINSAPRPLKLHLGCGPVIFPGWLNIDMLKTPGVAVMNLPRDLRKFDDQSVAFAYCSHMLEHINYPDNALTLCRELRRILVPGGAVRFVVPGIERIIRAYAANDVAFFEEQRSHHPAWCETKIEHLMYALQQDGQHKYGYDFETAKKLMLKAGFSRAVDSAYNKSEFPELRIDYRGENLSLFVDAIA